MKTSKNAYLAKLTEQIQMKSVKVGKNVKLVEVMAQVTLEGGFTAGDYLMVGIYKNNSLVKRVLCKRSSWKTLLYGG